MQLSEGDNAFRRTFGMVLSIEEDPQYYYALYFLKITHEYYELERLDNKYCEKIIDALKAYDFKALANAEDRQKENITIKSMEFTRSVFKPEDLNADNVDFVMRLCAIGFYIWFRVAVENPTDLLV